MLTALGYLILIAGLIFGFLYLSRGNKDFTIILIPLSSFLGSFLLAIPCWAAGEFIQLWINVANDISNINDNAFFIADILGKKEK